MISSISYSIPCTSRQLMLDSLAVTVVNQIAIYLLRSRTFENIRRIPMPAIQLENSKTVDESIAASKTRNERVVDLIHKQNKYRLCSMVTSCALAIFCMYKNFVPFSYAAMLLAFWDIKKFSDNQTVIASLRKKCIFPPELNRKAVEDFNNNITHSFSIDLNPLGKVELKRQEITRKDTTEEEEESELPEFIEQATNIEDGFRAKKMTLETKTTFTMTEKVLAVYHLK